MRTHWKQTVFYTRNELTIKRGEQVMGQFGSRPNARNERDIDFKIQVDFHGQLCEMEVEEHDYTMR